MKMKVSQWLEQIESHDAVNVDAARVDFEHETGEQWPMELRGKKAKELRPTVGKEFKGLQTLNATDEESIIGAWIVARTMARNFIGFYSKMEGRGSEFRDCIRALKEAGK